MRRTLHVRLSGAVGVLEHHLHRPHRVDVAGARLARQRLVVEADLAPLVGLVDAEQRLGERRLAGPRLAHETERLAVGKLEVDRHESGDVVTPLVERLGHVLELHHDPAAEHVDRGLRAGLGDLVEPVDVVTEREMAVTDRHLRRRGGAARLVGQRATIDEHTRRQVGADLGQAPWDREQRPVGLTDRMSGQALQQPDRVRMLGLLEHLDGISLLDELAGVHHTDPVAHRADHAEVVGDQQDRRVHLAAQGPHEVEHFGLDGGVEARRRLVEHEQRRIARQRHGDHDPLLHAARELVRIALHDARRVGDAHAAQRFEGVLLRLLAVMTKDGERLGHLLADLHRRVQRGGRILVHHRRRAGAEPAQVPVRHPHHVLAGDEDAATRDHRVGGQVPQRGEGRGRLAATRLAHQPVRLAGADMEAHAPQHLPRDAAHVVGEVEVLHGEGVRRGRRGRRHFAHAAITASIESATSVVANTKLAMASAGKIAGHQ